MGSSGLKELGLSKTLANTFSIPRPLPPKVPGPVHPRDRLHAYGCTTPGTTFWKLGACRRLGILEGGVVLGPHPSI